MTDDEMKVICYGTFPEGSYVLATSERKDLKKKQQMIARVQCSLACVASVSVGFGSKERPRNGVFGIFPARKMGREPKKERWG